MKNITTKQPASLRVFFATEMWERYGFYVVQSLLALYMALHYKWSDHRVYGLVGSFTAMTYLSPIIGGWIADYLIGQKRTVLTGAIFLFFSYLSLSFVYSDFGLIASLAGVAVGTGLLKPNISSLLGNEYAIDSPQRESGFTIFYMGITTGIVLGTTIPSQLNAHFGWSVSFASAAFGMIIAFSVFYLGIKQYKIADYHPFEYHFIKLIKAVFMIGLLWTISFFILYYPKLADISFALVVLLSISYLVLSAKYESPAQARQTSVIGLLCIISIMFWSFYFQMFLSLTLFIARVVEPTLFGIQFPPPYYVTVQSLGMLVFGFFMARNKLQVNSSQSGARTGNKFVLAMVFMLIAYALIAIICHGNTSATLLSPLLFIPVYLLISVAELLLSPVGLAAITSLASRRKVSTMMGIFFISLGIGGFLSGKLANLTAITPAELAKLELKSHYLHLSNHSANLTALNSSEISLSILKLHYAQTFTQLFFILIIATLICIILNRVIKKLLECYAE